MAETHIAIFDAGAHQLFRRIGIAFQYIDIPLATQYFTMEVLEEAGFNLAALDFVIFVIGDEWAQYKAMNHFPVIASIVSDRSLIITNTILPEYIIDTDLPIFNISDADDILSDNVKAKIEELIKTSSKGGIRSNRSRLNSQAIDNNVLDEMPDGQISINPLLFTSVDDMGFSIRTAHSFRQGNIVYLGDIVQMSEVSLLKLPNFGRKSLVELKGVLWKIGLKIGTEIPGWPPEDFERQADLAAAQRVSAMRQATLGVTFEASSEFLVVETIGDQSDREAGERSAVQQLRAEVLRKAVKFDSLASRLDNQVGWQGISSLCTRLIALLDRPANEIPEILGSLYSVALEVGSFYELDTAIRRGEETYAAPLDPEVRRPLEDLLRSLAPWLRSFPSIKEMDDEAGQFLAPLPALKVSGDVIRTADRTTLIKNEDAQDLHALLDAATRGGFQGVKAGRRGTLSARNLVIAALGVLSGLMLSDYGTKSVLIGKAGTFLADAEASIVELIADLPIDLRSAIEIVIGQNERPLLPPAKPDLPVPDAKRPPRRSKRPPR